MTRDEFLAQHLFQVYRGGEKAGRIVAASTVSGPRISTMLSAGAPKNMYDTTAFRPGTELAERDQLIAIRQHGRGYGVYLTADEVERLEHPEGGYGTEHNHPLTERQAAYLEELMKRK